GEDSDKLPSEKIYNELDNSLDCTGVTGGKGSIKPDKEILRIRLLIKEVYDSTLASEILRGYCYACTKNRDKAPNGNWCHLFYYWMGHKIKGKLPKHGDFTGAMRAAYHYLESLNYEDKCTNIYSDMGEVVFEKSKIKFDSDYNYKVLSELHEGNKHPRCHEYNGNLEAVKSAYLSLCNTCDDSDDKYCLGFKRQYNSGRSCKSWNPPQLTCTPDPASVLGSSINEDNANGVAVTRGVEEEKGRKKRKEKKKGKGREGKKGAGWDQKVKKNHQIHRVYQVRQKKRKEVTNMCIIRNIYYYTKKRKEFREGV
ncbi:KIR-like CYIR protein, partial [Plasmodium cynomolgi strain B]